MKLSAKLVLLIAGASLALSLLVFSPRLWLMRSPKPGTYQWTRAETYLKQCAEPFRHDIEPAMSWRLLPPAVCHVVGLTDRGAFLLPWLGVLAATVYAAVLAARRHDDWRFTFGCTLLFTCSSAILVPLHWFGINDAWAWLGLLAVTFAQNRWARGAAVLLAPWVDERFLIALPLALLVRRLDQPGTSLARHSRVLLWLLPYAAIRLWFSRQSVYLQPTTSFLTAHLAQAPIVLPLAPMGWWMAWRAGWLPAAYALRARPWELGAALLLTLCTGMVLAADLSRTAAMLSPLVLGGCFLYARDRKLEAPRVVLLIALANLLIPAAHVVYKSLDPVNPLPIELLRLFRIPG